MVRGGRWSLLRWKSRLLNWLPVSHISAPVHALCMTNEPSVKSMIFRKCFKFDHSAQQPTGSSLKIWWWIEDGEFGHLLIIISHLDNH